MVLATVQQHALYLRVSHILLGKKCVSRQVIHQALCFFTLTVTLAYQNDIAMQRELDRVKMPQHLGEPHDRLVFIGFTQLKVGLKLVPES